MKLPLLTGLIVSCGWNTVATASTPRVRDVVCSQIAHAISSASEVFYPGELPTSTFNAKPSNFHARAHIIHVICTGDPLYEKGIFHAAISSTQESKCVVEAGTADDVGKIVSFTLAPVPCTTVEECLFR